MKSNLGEGVVYLGLFVLYTLGLFFEGREKKKDSEDFYSLWKHQHQESTLTFEQWQALKQKGLLPK